MIKVCHITSVHQSHDARIFLKECVSLANNNYEVSYIVANAKTEKINKVFIKGVSSPVKNRVGRVFKTVYKVYKEAKKENANVYHLHDPELLLIALFLKSKNSKVVYDSHEDLPRQLLAKFWIPLPLRKVLSVLTELFENFIAKRIDGVIAATPFIRDRFLKINSNTIDINNYPIIKELITSENTEQKENSVFYVGGVTRVRGIVELVKSLELCKEPVKLNLAGIFAPTELFDEIKQLKGWEKVNYKGFVDRVELKQLLFSSKAGVVTLYPTINYLDSLPIKMFEYMACGLPIIVSNFPFWIELLKNENCALFVDPKNEKEIAQAIDYLLKNDDIAKAMGERGKNMVLQKFNWEVEEQKLYKFYQNILN